MREGGHRHGLDVVRHDEVAPIESRLGPRASFISASDPRGLAPTWTLGLSRVAPTSATM